MAYSHYKTITVDHTKVGTGGVSNFAVRVRTTNDTDIGPRAQFDGDDLAVYDSAGTTKLPHALVRYHAVAQSDCGMTWYNDPRAIRSGGFLYVGYISSTGTVGVRAYNESSGAWTDSAIVTGFQVDDHNNPALLMRGDGKLLACYSQHNGISYYAKGTISGGGGTITWGTPTQLEASGAAYAHVFKLSGNGKTYWFYRKNSGGTYANSWPLFYRTSSDDGDTWGSATLLFEVDPTTISASPQARPYTKVCRNGANKLEFATTDGHPSEVATNSLYHFSLDTSGGSDVFKKADGTTLTLPLNNTNVQKVYAGTTNRAWTNDIAADGSGYPVIAYTAYHGSPNPYTDPRYRYARWTGAAWVDNEIVAQGGSYSNSITGELYYHGGIALDRSDPSTVYLIRLDVRKSLVKYTTANNGSTWSGPTAVGNKSGGDDTTDGSSPTRITLRPYCPEGASASVPVVWVDGTYGTTYTSYNVDLVVPYGPACTVARVVDLYFKAPSLSDSADTVFRLYYGDSALSAQEDVANTFPDDVLIVIGDDANYEQLDLLLTGAVVDKNPSGTVIMAEATGGHFGPRQRAGGTTQLPLGVSPNLAGATAYTVAISVEPQSAGQATQAILSDFNTAKAGILFRHATADYQPDFEHVDSAAAIKGGKFTDIAQAVGTRRRNVFRWSTSAGIIEGFRDNVLSATTFAATNALHATASDPMHLSSSPHNATQRFKGYVEAVRVLKNKRWSDAEVATDYNNYASPGTFYTLGAQTSASTSSYRPDLRRMTRGLNRGLVRGMA